MFKKLIKITSDKATLVATDAVKESVKETVDKGVQEWAPLVVSFVLGVAVACIFKRSPVTVMVMR